MSREGKKMSEAAVRYTTREEGNVIRIVPQRLKKDGSVKNTVCNKKAGVKSEVYAFSMEDMRRVIDYFTVREMWLPRLALELSCNMARRVGDILALKWENFFDARENFRDELASISEEKTGKLAAPHINQEVRNAIWFYCNKTGCVPKDDFTAPVFLQLSGNYKGRVLSYSGYLKSLKRAAQELGIEYNVGSHSARKTFGKYSRELHSGDVNAMEILQGIYNHSSANTTRSYIGITRERQNKYYDDFGIFFKDCVEGNIQDMRAESPVVHLESGDLRELLKLAYSMGLENAASDDPQVHINAFADLEELVESIRK